MYRDQWEAGSENLMTLKVRSLFPPKTIVQAANSANKGMPPVKQVLVTFGEVIAKDEDYFSCAQFSEK